MMPKENLRKADVVTSIVLVLLGAGIILESTRMPLSGTYGGRPVHWYTSPAFFPMILGALLVLMSVGVFLRAVRDGGHRGLARVVARSMKSLPRSRPARRTLLVWVLVGAYTALLSWHPFAACSGWLESFGRRDSPLVSFLLEPEGINYVLSTTLFLCAFGFSFYLPSSPSPRWRRGVLLVALSMLFSWAVGYVFTQHLYTPLPW